MNKKLYVGGLPYSSTEDSVRQAFSGAGVVEDITIIYDKMTGRSRGFGFVTMSTEEEAVRAIDMWNGKDFEGRKLVVNEAQSREASPRGSFNGRGNNRRSRSNFDRVW
jgi:RNA recognition motif-containing protein